MIVATDLNMLSVLQYAVEALEIKHIILCGHYGCGRVRAAMGRQYLGPINQWLCHIKDVYRDHQEELEAIKDLDKRADRLVELNVIAQAYNLVKTSTVQNAWHVGAFPNIHGWVYSLRDGSAYPPQSGWLAGYGRLKDGERLLRTDRLGRSVPVHGYTS